MELLQRWLRALAWPYPLEEATEAQMLDGACHLTGSLLPSPSISGRGGVTSRKSREGSPHAGWCLDPSRGGFGNIVALPRHEADDVAAERLDGNADSPHANAGVDEP